MFLFPESGPKKNFRVTASLKPRPRNPGLKGLSGNGFTKTVTPHLRSIVPNVQRHMAYFAERTARDAHRGAGKAGLFVEGAPLVIQTHEFDTAVVWACRGANCWHTNSPASALRINLNIQGCNIVAPPLHAPSRAPLLLPLLLSRNIPLPRVH